MSRDATETREKLLRAAEQLFARHGLDVPIREIHALAGQRNASAIQYHFGGKDELLAAIVERHAPSPEDMKVVRADLEARRDDPRSFVEAVVRRLCGFLTTPERRDYVRLSLHLMMRTSLRAVMAEGSQHHSLTTARAETDLLHTILPGLPERIVRERAVATLSFIALEVAERARQIDDGPAEVLLDEDEFVANLVDMATAALTTPSSLAAT